MTNSELAELPVGTTVVLDDDELGEIVQAGAVVHIKWSDCTIIIYTDSKVWETFVCYLEA